MVFKPLLTIFLSILLFVNITLAEQTTNIFKSRINYIDTATKNVWYNTTINFNPPSFNNTLSAFITLKADINSESQVYLLINNNSCFPSTFSPAGGTRQEEMFFDCTNIINNTGMYNISFRWNSNVGQAYMRNVFGQIEITYFNKPRPELKILGTEYSIGERGTVFLQLKDQNGNVVNNGNCYINIYYPDMPNATKPKWIHNAPMMYKENSNGLYYYDFYVPNYTGVYMIDAECSYIYTPEWYYLDKIDEKPKRTVLQGTYIGDTSFLNDYEDWIYTQCNSGGGATKYCDAYYDFVLDNVSIHKLDLYWAGESRNNPLLQFYVWNWTSNSWYLLPNSVTLYPTGSSVPIGLAEFMTNSIPDLNNTIASNKTVRIRTTYSLGTSFIAWDNWLGLKASQIKYFIVDIKGSGEIHASDRLNLTNSSIFSKLYMIQDEISSVNDTVKSVNSSISGQIHSFNSSITNYLSNLPSLVWNYTVRTLTGFGNLISEIWNYENRNLTYYPSLNVTLNITNVTTVINITNTTFDTTNITNAITSVNDTVKSTNTTVNWWGNELERKLDDIVLGNVTVNATVDYDKIATYVLMYLKGVKFWCWFMPERCR